MTFLGEAGTGKSCLLHHFTHNSCPFSLAFIRQSLVSDRMVVKDHSQHTIGVEFSSRTVRLGEKRIKLQVRYCFFNLWTFYQCFLPVSYGIQQGKNVSG